MIAKGRSKTCLKTYILKEAKGSICSNIIIPTIIEDKEISILQEQATLHPDKFRESNGVVLVEIGSQIIKYKEAASQSLELFLDKLMLTLRSKCTEIGISETICKFRRKKT